MALMETNLRHPSLQTHKYDALSGDDGEEVFEAYVENKCDSLLLGFFGTTVQTKK